ncbi:MAG TPA: HemK/PrmC family methyltransferase, partial [Aquabacterium sp.]|nr:HemK/PrmC family methyltransferase [Aquabacterium sp.]
WALEHTPIDRPCDVLDLGTGSGAIALAIAHQRPLASVTAVDASAAALETARLNAERLGVSVRFYLGSWLAPVGSDRFDLIVSNPPYIAEGDAHLPALKHEPITALTSGPDGLDDIRHIVTQAKTHLRPGGWLLLEHGFDQAGAVSQLLKQAGYDQVTTRRDLGGQNRCTGGQTL